MHPGLSIAYPGMAKILTNAIVMRTTNSPTGLSPRISVWPIIIITPRSRDVPAMNSYFATMKWPYQTRWVSKFPFRAVRLTTSTRRWGPRDLSAAIYSRTPDSQQTWTLTISHLISAHTTGPTVFNRLSYKYDMIGILAIVYYNVYYETLIGRFTSWMTGWKIQDSFILTLSLVNINRWSGLYDA